jgi:signal transduction histidine kinase
VRSLRSRLLLAAALWTFGLFVTIGIIFGHVAMRHPWMRQSMHELFVHPVTVAVTVACLVGGLVHLRRGVGAIARLRARLAAVHAGETTRLDGVYPAEVQPLVDDLNALLDAREQTVRRAIAKAGDLAHGLKTPLSVLAHEAERADAAGQHEWSAAIVQQVERMRRQMDYHLAHARAAASGPAPGARCGVRASADALARTLLRLHADRGLAIDVTIGAGGTGDVAVRGQREDLDEMLGNLLDNACKWARRRVALAAREEGGVVVIDVDDDGPGLPASMRDAVLQRGVRADEAAPGTGFGLAIVRDLAEVYGGSIALGASPLGGLRATLRLPSADRSL